MRTSDSDPILVAFPLFSGLRGRIGLTLAPGKRHAAWARDLDADLTRLRDAYGVDTLVTLLEEDERDRLGISRLEQAASERGMRTFALPIPDGGVPGSMAAAIELVRAVLAVASAGETVVVHCRGGLGRSGTIVACCRAAFGRPVAEAIEAVRVARPGAIENRRQEAFVAEFATAWAAAPAIVPSVSRFIGCMLGGALGDALGYPVGLRASVRDLEGALGPMVPERLPSRPGEKAIVSSETQMALFTVEGVLRSVARSMNRGGTVGETVVVGHALQRWLETQTGEGSERWRDEGKRGFLIDVPGLRHRRAPDATCLDALSASLTTEGAASNPSKSRGAIARSAPIGLGATSVEHAFELARDAARVTHGHPSAYLSAAYFAAVIHGVARDVPLPEAMATADSLVREAPDADEVITAVTRARAIAAGPASVLGAGRTADEALAVALALGLTATRESVGASMWRAVTQVEDGSGTLTGNLLGAMFGAESLPQAWVMGVELHDVIEPIAIELHATTVLNIEPNPRRYPPN